MPSVIIKESPLVPDVKPVEIYYREYGSGIPFVFLHGGWGYQIYPFDKQIEEFSDRFRILMPDRSGYGRSFRMNEFKPDFHQRATVETINFLDALNIERAVLWGHSDGAVIAALAALAAPSRFFGIILEAFHYDRRKHGSRGFFQTMAEEPEKFGERICRTLESDHGSDYWRKVLEMDGRAWLKIIEESVLPEKDLYQGKLSEISVPTLFIHGSRDPRTEPGEIEAVRDMLPKAKIHIIENGGHSPHSESAAAEESCRAAAEFLRNIFDQSVINNFQSISE